MVYSIIKKNELERALRLDAEYYQPEYLKIGDLLKNSKIISDIANTYDLQSNGAFAQIFSILNDNNEKIIPYIRSENVGDFFINTNDLAFISQNAHLKLPKTQTKFEDVVMARKGKIGGATLITKDVIDFNSNDNIVNIKIKDKGQLDPYYFTAFFNSAIGIKQVERFATGNVQPWLSMFQLRSLKVFIPPIAKQLEIRRFIEEAFVYINKSKSFYSEAEDLLLEELGLKDFQVEDDLSFVVNLSDIKKAKRVDAEYFQPKYQKLIEQIQKNNAKMLGDLVSMKKGCEPGSEAYQEEGKLFIRVSSLSKFGIDDKDQKYLNDELYKQLKKDFEPQIGEVLLTKDATPGVVYVVKEAIEGVISGGILRLKTKDNIDSEYLALCINSILGKMQVERDAGGSVIAHWKPEQIKNLIIPILPKPTQQKIAEMVRKSHEARKKSKELLEEAKRKVEEMIEKG